MRTRSSRLGHAFLFTLVPGALVVMFSAGSALAQQKGPATPASKATQPAAKEAAEEYQPQRGQAGKDVVWIPTSDDLVAAMLDTAKVTKDDIVYDLGSGDGRTVIAAAKRGAQAIGVEYNPDLVGLAKSNAEKAGAKNANFIHGDIFVTDFSKATVVTLFLLPALNLKLRPTILNMKPGTRVVSNSFDMGDWAAHQTIELGQDASCMSFCRAFYWIVPAKIEGRWQTTQGDLTLTQKYQMISGRLKGAEVTGQLDGNKVTLTSGSTVWNGVVDGNKLSLASGNNKMEGTKR